MVKWVNIWVNIWVRLFHVHLLMFAKPSHPIHYNLTSSQLIELFDAEMANSERLRAGEMLYARCVQPLDFWLQVLPTMAPIQVG
jgi:hypothetical protein